MEASIRNAKNMVFKEWAHGMIFMGSPCFLFYFYAMDIEPIDRHFIFGGSSYFTFPLKSVI